MRSTRPATASSSSRSATTASSPTSARRSAPPSSPPIRASPPTRTGSRTAKRSKVELERHLAARPAAEWSAELLARRVPAGQVNDLGAAFAFAESIGLEPTVEIPREDGSTVSLTRSPIRLSASPATYRTAPPLLPVEEAR